MAPSLTTPLARFTGARGGLVVSCQWSESGLQWAVWVGCGSAAVAGEQLFGFLGEDAADFAAFAFDARDVH